MKINRLLCLAGSVLVLLCVALYVRASNEIALDAALTVSKGYLSIDRNPGSISITMTGDKASDIVQAFTTSSTSLVTIASGVLTNGYMYSQNLTTNSTRHVVIGVTNATGFVSVLKLKAQEIGVFRLFPGTLLFAHGVGGTVNLRTLIVEN